MSLGLILLLPLLGSLLNGVFALKASVTKRPLPELLIAIVGVLFPFLAFLVAVKASWPFLLHGQLAPTQEHLFDWVVSGPFAVSASLLLDRLSVVMVLVVTGVGTLIHFYSRGYMHGDAGFARYYCYLNLFLFSMLVLVLADNLLFLFVGWEGVGLCSYLLIGFYFTDADKAAAGKKAFVVNRIGDFGFLIGILLILAQLGMSVSAGENILSFNYLAQHVEQLAPVAGWITFCLFLGATGKSAQIPLYVWLPDAMAGPTPVSALIHAATMVTAGVYMMVRLFFLFNYDLAPYTMQLIATVGAATALFAATIGLVQNDIKKVLAYSTVSQLGYMVLGVGVGAYGAAIFHLMTHAFFKACLFLGAGAVIHSLHHEQDIQKMGGLKSKLPVVFVTFTIASLAIAGIPPLAGFFSKDEILFQTYVTGHRYLYTVAFIAAGFTAFYMFRLVALTFLGKSRQEHHGHHHEAHVQKVPFNMQSVLVVLALLSVVGGWVGIPDALGHGLGLHNYWQAWLPFGLGEAGLEGHDVHSLEIELAFISALWGALFVGLAIYIYLKKPTLPQVWAQKLKWVYALLREKYFIDEIYNALIIQPIKRMSQYVLAKFCDQGIIDTLFIKGLAFFTQVGGGLANRFQNGSVNAYVLYFFVALIGLLTWALV